jgi:hypothetical protein
VIDIHGHSFNSLSLPIEGVALGKRDIHPVAVLFRDSLVCAITDWITGITLHSENSGVFDDQCYSPNSQLIINCAKRATNRFPDSPVTSEDLAKHPLVTCISKLLDPNHEDRNLGFLEKVAMNYFKGFFSTHGADLEIFTTGSEGSKFAGVKRFMHTLTRSRHAQVDAFHDAFEGRVSLMASMMMDLAPVYDQNEDGELLLPFSTEQISSMQRQQEDAGGSMLYFVAFNPFRDHWGSHHGPGSSLDIVKYACEKQGAWGVKVYPPSGYSAFETTIPRRPFSISCHPHRQWKARYKPGGKLIDPAEIDRRMDALFSWSLENDIPLFTHSGTDEVQARKGYGERFANPIHWKKRIESDGHSHLRICLAHAGGGDFWFGKGKHQDWGRTVFELCIKYPNVYCEFGAFDEIMEPASRDAFSRRMVELIRESRSRQGCFDFSKKIMYGSDWFMPNSKGTPVQYLESFQTAMLDVAKHLDDDGASYKDFFIRNALTYLNAENRPNHLRLPQDTLSRIRQLQQKSLK